MPERHLDDTFSAAGRRGAEASWRDLPPGDPRRADRTAPAREARRRALDADVATRQALAERLAALADAMPRLPVLERARQLRALADFAEAGVELADRRRRRRGDKPLADAAKAS